MELRQRRLAMSTELEAINIELANWESILAGYKSLSQKNADTLEPRKGAQKIGITKGIRFILGQHPEGITPTEIRTELTKYGIKSRDEKHFLQNIHSLLKRMDDVESEIEKSLGDKRVWAIKKYRFKKK